MLLAKAKSPHCWGLLKKSRLVALLAKKSQKVGCNNFFLSLKDILNKVLGKMKNILNVGAKVIFLNVPLNAQLFFQLLQLQQSPNHKPGS